MKDKEVSTVKVYETFDYGKFQFLDYNRHVSSTGIVEKSIRGKDMTKYTPIIVTKDFEIIDGQHRFIACRKMGLPIYYIIYDGEYDPEEVVVTLNTAMKSWRMEEWLEYYCGMGFPHYVRLRELMEMYSLNLSNCSTLYSGFSVNTQSFKKGQLVGDEEYVAAFLKFAEGLPKKYVERLHFVRAWVQFYKRHNGDKKIMNRLKKKAVTIPVFGITEDYLIAFENLTR